MYTKGTGLDCPLCKKEIEISNCLDVEAMNKLNSHKDLLEACKEAVILFNDTREGVYKPDSFTTQPLEQAILKAEGKA